MIAQGHGLVGARVGRKRRGMLDDVVLTEAQRKRIADNTGLAGIAAREAIKRWGVDKDDAYASALFGLCKAAVGFDESLGNQFSTYAVDACTKTIYRDLVFQPTAMCDRTRHGRTRRAERVVSMDDEIDINGKGKRRRRGSIIPDHRERTPIEQLEHDEMMREARQWMDQITAESDRMHTVIRIRTEGGTLHDAGDAIGLSRERTRQLEAKHIGHPLGRSNNRNAEALAS